MYKTLPSLSNPILTGSTQLAHPSQALKNWKRQPSKAEAAISPLEAHLCGGFETRGGGAAVAGGGERVTGVEGGGGGGGAGIGGNGLVWRSHPESLAAPEEEEVLASARSESQGRIFPKKVIKYILRPVMKTRKSST